jgi:hypothetical protein
MVMSANEEALKGAIENRIRESAYKNGIDPNERWKWYLRTKNGKPVMASDMVEYLTAEAKRQGWYDDCALDYEASRPFEDFPVTVDMQHVFIPNFGGSEGIYLDWECIERGYGKEQRHRVSCWKTLETSAKAMAAMGRLGGRLTYLANTIL